jgi:5-(aminomethyl)-3-furanmethanol phosphate kinase
MVEIVVKVGGALLAHCDDFAAVLDTIDAAVGNRRLLVVPGGGPFADAVRDVDRRLQLADETAHWMAVLAMDQYAHLIADRLAHGVLVADRAAISTALDAGRLPVLAPFAWLRHVDPLPHSWDVTSDSIAAWVAGELGARRLVLIKPPGALRRGAELVDAHFAQALPTGIDVVSLGGEQHEALRAQLFGPRT